MKSLLSIRNSAEALYLYLVGLAAHVLGPGTLAIQVVGWAFGLAIVGLIGSSWALVPPSHRVPLLTAACSLWLFHYARNGLRLSPPLFLAAFALLLDRAERRSTALGAPLLAGIVLGLSIYGYTSARALPLAFLAYAAYRIVRRAAPRPELLRRYGTVLAGAFVISVPNLLFFLRHPKEFLTRGDTDDWCRRLRGELILVDPVPLLLFGPLPHIRRSIHLRLVAAA